MTFTNSRLYEDMLNHQKLEEANKKLKHNDKGYCYLIMTPRKLDIHNMKIEELTKELLRKRGWKIIKKEIEL